MLTEMLDKINKYLEEREEKKYQKLQRELEEEYGDPEEVPESTYEEVENTNEIDMNIKEPNEEEINMNIQEPTEEEIDMNVIPKKKKGIRGFFQNLKAKGMQKFNSELKESTTKMDIANATLFTIIQSIILTGTIVVGVMNPAVGFLAGILASVCTLAVIADIKDAIVKYIEYKNEEKIEENQAEINIEEKTENSLEPTISYSFTKDGLKIAKVDLTNIHTDPGLYINQELFGFKNETADAKQFVVNRKDEAVNHYVASEIENVTGMKPTYMDCPIKGNEKRVYILPKMFKR